MLKGVTVVCRFEQPARRRRHPPEGWVLGMNRNRGNAATHVGGAKFAPLKRFGPIQRHHHSGGGFRFGLAAGLNLTGRLLLISFAASLLGRGFGGELNRQNEYTQKGTEAPFGIGSGNHWIMLPGAGSSLKCTGLDWKRGGTAISGNNHSSRKGTNPQTESNSPDFSFLGQGTDPGPANLQQKVQRLPRDLEAHSRRLFDLHPQGRKDRRPKVPRGASLIAGVAACRIA